MAKHKKMGKIIPFSAFAKSELERMNDFCREFQRKYSRSPKLEELRKAFPKNRIGAFSTSVEEWTKFDFLYDGRRIGAVSHNPIKMDDLLE